MLLTASVKKLPERVHLLASILQGRILTSEAVSLDAMPPTSCKRLKSESSQLVTSSPTVPVVQIGQEQAATNTFNDIRNFESNRNDTSVLTHS